MNLGNFYVALSVKDLDTSVAFYEALGFSTWGGAREQGWLILRSPTCTIGLYQGHIEKNTLTFNPGWDRDAQTLASFTDVRELQKQAKAAGLSLEREADESGEGPDYFIVHDPDGNPVMVDQHV